MLLCKLRCMGVSCRRRERHNWRANLLDPALATARTGHEILQASQEDLMTNVIRAQMSVTWVLEYYGGFGFTGLGHFRRLLLQPRGHASTALPTSAYRYSGSKRPPVRPLCRIKRMFRDTRIAEVLIVTY